MCEEANTRPALETGGLLLGRETTTETMVTHVIGPGPGAVHAAKSFTPDRDWQYERIDEIFVARSGDIRYLGDWHTHPGGKAVPSSLDLALLRRTAENPDCKCPNPVMAILARPNPEHSWNSRVYRYAPAARLRSRIVPVPISFTNACM